MVGTAEVLFSLHQLIVLTRQSSPFSVLEARVVVGPELGVTRVPKRGQVIYVRYQLRDILYLGEK